MDTKNNVENVLDKDASLAERVCTSDNINTYCFFYDPLNNCTYYHRCLWMSAAPGLSQLKDKGALRKWLNKLACPMTRFATKLAEAFPAINKKFLVPF